MAGSLRRIGVVLAGLIVVSAMIVTTAATAGAKIVKPVITLTASPTTVTDNDGTVTVSATVANASSCTLSSSLALSNLPASGNCSGGSFTERVVIPENTGKKAQNYKFTLTAVGQATKSKRVKVIVDAGDGRPALSGVESVYGAATNATDSPDTYCAILAANGAVDCWGDNTYGELGDGSLSGPQTCGSVSCALIPQSVVGVGGSGTLTGVKSLASAGNFGSFCALLTSGSVDCWGDDWLGELGNGGQTAEGVGVPYPVQVLGVDGSGVLSGVTSLVGGVFDYCALLNTGNVVCWGYGAEGQLGYGPAPESSLPAYNVDFPVYTATGLDPETMNPIPLTGAVGLASEGGSDSGAYCAVLTGGAADCWGIDNNGDLGNGAYGPDNCGGDDCSIFATPVVGIGDSGTLSGVADIVGSFAGACAVLTGGGVDCWGDNRAGELGNGASGGSSDSPVSVEGIGGSGTLTNVTELATSVLDQSDCALLTSGKAACWGSNANGAVGDGNGAESNAPANVVGVGGSGTLSGLSALNGELRGFCATIASGNGDCWGYNGQGQLGAGVNPTCVTVLSGCSSPVTVLNVSGTGSLTGVANFGGNDESSCVVASGGVDCMGVNASGEIGNWGTQNQEYAVPATVFAPE